MPWFRLFPICWKAVHSDVLPVNGFRYTQARGPIESLVHRHMFESYALNLTEVIDEIQAEPSEYLFRGIMSHHMGLILPILFTYRVWQTKYEVEVR